MLQSGAMTETLPFSSSVCLRVGCMAMKHRGSRAASEVAALFALRDTESMSSTRSSVCRNPWHRQTRAARLLDPELRWIIDALVLHEAVEVGLCRRDLLFLDDRSAHAGQNGGIEVRLDAREKHAAVGIVEGEASYADHDTPASEKTIAVLPERSQKKPRMQFLNENDFAIAVPFGFCQAKRGSVSLNLARRKENFW